MMGESAGAGVSGLLGVEQSTLRLVDRRICARATRLLGCSSFGQVGRNLRLLADLVASIRSRAGYDWAW